MKTKFVKIKDLKIRTKLFIGFGLVLSLALVMGWISFFKGVSYSKAVDSQVSNLKLGKFLFNTKAKQFKWTSKVGELFLYNKKELKVKTDYKTCTLGKWYFKFIDSEDFKNYPKSLKLAILSMDKPHIRLHETSIRIKKKWDLSNSEAMDLCRNIYRDETLKALHDLILTFDNVSDELEKQNKILSHQQASSLKTMKSSIIFLLIISIILGLFVALYISNAIGKPIKLVVTKLKDIAEGEGDLTQQIDIESKDELGDLAKYFNKFLDQLRNMVKNISSSSEEIAAASEELSATSKQISKSSESVSSVTGETSRSVSQIDKNIKEVVSIIETQITSTAQVSSSVDEMSNNIEEVLKSVESQAASVNQSTAAVEELSASIKMVSANSDKVTVLSNRINKNAQEGNSAVKESVTGMKDIAESADKINNIIGVITGIASQTNLLALNAAIEAARAGEAGKGFAVVADEVRGLAEQSAQAAKEITDLIKESNSKAEKGVILIEGVDKIISGMISSIQEVSQLTEEVGVSTGEQEKGAEEIAKAMEELNAITQGILTSMEEQSKSSFSVSEEMGNLSQISSEINSIMTEQASGSEEITKAISELQTIAQENSAGATQSVEAVVGLSSEAQQLDTLVKRFKV